jgi:hypothetical protein
LKEATARDVTLPAGLVDRVEKGLVRARRRHLLLRAAALAAVVLLAVGTLVWIVKRPGGPSVLAKNPPVDGPAPTWPTHVATRVVITPSSGLTAVPIQSKNPNVTIVWLFPHRPRTPDRRSMPAASSTRSQS